MTNFKALLTSQADLDAANTIATFLAPDDSAALTHTTIDIVIHAGNAILETIHSACKAALTHDCPILFSGGIGHSTTLLIEAAQAAHPSLAQDMSPLSEADIGGLIARDIFHIPQDRIILETKSRNCGENASLTLKALTGVSLTPRNAALFQDPTMQRRTLVTFHRAWETASFQTQFHSCPSFVPHLTEQFTYANPPQTPLWTADRFLSLLMGEIPRLRDDENGYGPKGQNFIPHVEIPPAVEDAVLTLRACLKARGATTTRVAAPLSPP